MIAFIVAAFEHCVANMTIFMLGVTTGAASWQDFARNLAFTVPGKIVGGALIVGGSYWLIGHIRRPPVTSSGNGEGPVPRDAPMVQHLAKGDGNPR